MKLLYDLHSRFGIERPPGWLYYRSKFAYFRFRVFLCNAMTLSASEKDDAGNEVTIEVDTDAFSGVVIYKQPSQKNPSSYSVRETTRNGLLVALERTSLNFELNRLRKKAVAEIQKQWP